MILAHMFVGEIKDNTEATGLYFRNNFVFFFLFFYRAILVDLLGRGGSWQCCHWNARLSWLYLA